MSATWRIYPSSKWSSQWPYDGYIRHGWMISCGRGRDSATLECFARGYRGTIFVRSSKLSLFFPELCPLRRAFLFPALLKDLAPNVRALGLFWFRRCFGALFANSAPSPGIFLQTLTTTTSISWKFPFFFPKQSRFYLPDSYSDPKSKQSTLVMVSRKLEWKLDFRALVRSSAEGPSIVVVIGTSRVRWSMVQRRKKKQGSQRVIVRRLNPSSSTNQRVLRSLVPRLDVSTVSHFALFVDVDVQLQGGQAAARGQRRKAVIRDISGVDHWGVTNLTAPIWFTGQRHCTVFRHVMQLSLLVPCRKSTLTVILQQIKKKRSLLNVGHRGTKAENLAWHSTG